MSHSVSSRCSCLLSCCKDFMQMRFSTLQVSHTRHLDVYLQLYYWTLIFLVNQVGDITGVNALLSPRALAALRALMCVLYVIIIVFQSIGSEETFGRWLSFLTNWTWVLCLFVLFPALFISLYFLKYQPPASTKTWMRVHWIMWEMAGRDRFPSNSNDFVPHGIQLHSLLPSPFFTGCCCTSLASLFTFQ